MLAGVTFFFGNVFEVALYDDDINRYVSRLLIKCLSYQYCNSLFAIFWKYQVVFKPGDYSVRCEFLYNAVRGDVATACEKDNNSA
jgi:hypothetical protein